MILRKSAATPSEPVTAFLRRWTGLRLFRPSLLRLLLIGFSQPINNEEA